VSAGNDVILAELRLLRGSVEKVDDKIEKTSKDAHETHLLLKAHTDEFNKYKSEMDPVKQDYIERQVLKKAEEESSKKKERKWKGLGVKISIVAGVLGIITAWMQWR
jgi:uncharacterized coiled-coil DUF342 family protein